MIGRRRRAGRITRGALTLAIVGVCAATVVAGAAVTNGRYTNNPDDIVPLRAPTISPSGPLVSFTGLQPGEARSTTFEIRNPNAEDSVAKIIAELTGGDQLLYNQLAVELGSEGDIFWRGPINALMDPSSALTSVPGDGTRPVTLTLSVPPDLDDSYQSRLSEFTLKFALDHAIRRGVDRIPPATRVSAIKPNRKKLRKRNFYKRGRKRKQIIVFYGRASDEPSGVARVEVSLMRVVNKRKRERVCRSWSPTRGKYVINGARTGSCRRPLWYAASGTNTFSFLMFGRMIQRGRYIARVRAIDNAGNVETRFSPRKRNVMRFRIR